MRLCSPRRVGEAIQLRNYVGTLTLKGGKQIEILPKIDIAAGSEVDARKAFVDMLRTLGGNRAFKAMGKTKVDTASIPIFEIFAAMFLEEASRVASAGLVAGYTERHARQQFVKGRIDFASQAKEGPVHAELLHMDYDEFSLNRAENRLIKSTLELLRRRCCLSDNKRIAARTLTVFEGVPASTRYDADFAECSQGRDVRRYRTLLMWCEVFLKDNSLTTFKGSKVAEAILFPMERLFEDYVAAKLKQALTRTSESSLSRISSQVTGKSLFDNGCIRLRPDIIAYRNDGTCVVLDTKWKRVSESKDLSVSDMHQMYAYGKKFSANNVSGGAQRVILLYPWHAGTESGLATGLHHQSGDGVVVDAFFVDLSHMNESMALLLRELELGSLACNNYCTTF